MKSKLSKTCCKRGFTLRPSSSRNVLMRDIGAAHTLYPAFIATRRVGVTERVAHGFTLIELLVVVLIIGILAAVALPQYNKAVKKAQGAEVLNAIDAMDKALANFYLTHGSYNPRDFHISVEKEDLDMEMPVLKYWKYSRGNSSTFIELEAGGTKHLQRATFNSDPAGLNVTVSWNSGKLEQISCQEGSGANGRKCTDYFNCSEIEETKAVCGAPNCPTYTETNCYLN